MQRKSTNKLRIRKQRRSVYYNSEERGSGDNVSYHYDKGSNGFSLDNSGTGTVIERINNNVHDSYVDNMAMDFH